KRVFEAQIGQTVFGQPWQVKAALIGDVEERHVVADRGDLESKIVGAQYLLIKLQIPEAREIEFEEDAGPRFRIACGYQAGRDATGPAGKAQIVVMVVVAPPKEDRAGYPDFEGWQRLEGHHVGEDPGMLREWSDRVELTEKNCPPAGTEVTEQPWPGLGMNILHGEGRD